MQSDVNFPLVLCKPTSQIIQPKFNQCKRFVLHPHFPVIYLTISILGSSTIFGLSLKYTLRFVPSSIEPGYIVIPHLYNFADYGVPEFRERVLIVGIRVDTGFDFVHPAPTHGPQEGLLPWVTVGDAFVGVESVPNNNEHLRVTQRTKTIIGMISEGGNFTDIPEDSPYYVHGMISHVYRRINRNEPSKTIIAAGGGGTWGYHYPEPRPLTNRERARIQSFPDDFVFYGSTTEVRRQIGNAVPPVGVHAIAMALKPLFMGHFSKVDLYKKLEILKAMPFEERYKLIK